jgi:hypothetical protein
MTRAFSRVPQSLARRSPEPLHAPGADARASHRRLRNLTAGGSNAFFLLELMEVCCDIERPRPPSRPAGLGFAFYGAHEARSNAIHGNALRGYEWRKTMELSGGQASPAANKQTLRKCWLNWCDSSNLQGGSRTRVRRRLQTPRRSLPSRPGRSRLSRPCRSPTERTRGPGNRPR